MTSPGSSPHRPDTVLAVCGCESLLLLALARRDGEAASVAASLALDTGGRSTPVLLPAVESLLRLAGMKGADLEGIACARGPGSFTGIRVCLAASAGLARGWGLPLAGLDYLPLLAASAPPFTDGVLAVITHARRGQVNLQFFAPGGRPLDAPRMAGADEAAGQLAALPGPVRVLGSGLRRNPDSFGHLAEPLPLPARYDHPAPHALAKAALEADYARDLPEPLYLRPSDAEENLERIAAQRGLATDEARRRLRRAENGSS
ncbi:tRNA (adenosine(37)-N6)-threonylcarbamoyltransferase complex dimerization subunit type 1 TsaB [Desulfohalovibrio reitneri]|uniref:tRNA (adenosine(37)-N6)-threonylcarbamoyltransferase complex dimerization subunit type 1 TsaB n=1 Tax=Desulfohalovibrio reitneri TaxID=1307759 RepID=UPI0004A6B36B|nr:tRNA (adenosine(37)-N6)-threonylcarbamoyltransferase complex dimerization subunit type 1 TsaB [Desulfohalovibrio reitneri]